MVKRNRDVCSMDVTADGQGLVTHAGARLGSGMAEVVGLGDAWSEAIIPTVPPALTEQCCT